MKIVGIEVEKIVDGALVLVSLVGGALARPDVIRTLARNVRWGENADRVLLKSSLEVIEPRDLEVGVPPDVSRVEAVVVAARAM